MPRFKLRTKPSKDSEGYSQNVSEGAGDLRCAGGEEGGGSGGGGGGDRASLFTSVVNFDLMHLRHFKSLIGM